MCTCHLKKSFQRLRLTLVAALAGGATWCAAAESPRTWTDAGGRQIEATLVAAEKDKVRLMTPVGVEIAVALDRLSKADRDHLAGRNGEGPRTAPAAARTPPRGAECLVLVAMQYERNRLVKPGFVFHRDPQRAYVAVEAELVQGRPAGQTAPGGYSFSIVGGAAGQTREVKAELVVPHAHRGHWIVAAPAKDLPSPPAVDPAAVPSEATAVTVTGYTIRSANSAAPFTCVVEGATLKRIYRNTALEVDRYRIEGEAVAAFHHGLVTTAAGAPLGYFTLGPAMDRNQPKQGVDALPPRVLGALAQPEVREVLFAPRTGDRKSIEFEFVAFISDPLGLLESPRLSVTKIGEEQRGRPPFPPEMEAPRKPKAEAVELKLVKQAPSEQFVAQFPGYERSGRAATWVGRHMAVNEGPVSEYRYHVSLSYAGKDGAPQRIWQNLARYETKLPFASGMRRPDIPGLDGRPLESLRPEQKEGGGMQITGEATRVKGPPAAAPGKPPEPAKGSTSFAGKSSEEGDWESVQLAKQGPRLGGPTRPCETMAFSPDGKSLYLLDPKGALYKLRLSDFMAEQVLETGGVSRSISFSKEGLLIAVSHAHAVWVVDPATLRVVRQISVQNVTLVEGSPASSIAFAVGNRLQSAESGPLRPGVRPGRIVQPDVGIDPWMGGMGRPELWMLDLAKGRPLHCIPGGTDADYAPFNEGAERLQMRGDGKYLYMGASRIKRYRIEGEELVFEERSPEALNTRSRHFVVSDDNKLATAKAGPGHSHVDAVVLVDPLHLSQEKLALAPYLSPGAVGFDAATGNIYAAGRDNKVVVFSPRGGKLQEVSTADWMPNRLLVHPAGRSFVVWGEQKMTYCRMRKQ